MMTALRVTVLPLGVMLLVVVMLPVGIRTTQEVEDGGAFERLFVADYGEFGDGDFSQRILEHRSRQKRSIMYPGTKWCGPGNNAADNNDLGHKVALDMCCRQHDMCSEFIPANTTRYSLYNEKTFTSSHCDCDELFRECLHNISNGDSGFVGMIYFGAAKCFRYDYPASCIRRLSSNKRCLEYKFDTSQKMVWQFFDLLPWGPTPEEVSTMTPNSVAEYGASTAAKITAGSSITVIAVVGFVGVYSWYRLKLAPHDSSDKYNLLNQESV